MGDPNKGFFTIALNLRIQIFSCYKKPSVQENTAEELFKRCWRHCNFVYTDSKGEAGVFPSYGILPQSLLIRLSLLSVPSPLIIDPLVPTKME
jgi:hypothetical protein